MTLAPIVLFVYNRPWHTEQVVNSLQKCELANESDLYIFADGPKNSATDDVKIKISEVRKYLHSIKGFRSIHFDEAETNRGCANSIIYGVNKVINQFGKAIVVEDDIVAHPFFLRFMNEALAFYENDKRIFCISATMEKFTIPKDYKYDVFLTHRTGSWGWATWGDRWRTVDWDMEHYTIISHPTRKQIKKICRGGDDLWPMLLSQWRGKIDAWDIRWLYNMSIQNKLCLRSTVSFVNNIGMDDSGVHCTEGNVPLLPMYNKSLYNLELVPLTRPNKIISKNIRFVFEDKNKESVRFSKRIKRWIKRTLGLQNLNFLKQRVLL